MSTQTAARGYEGCPAERQPVIPVKYDIMPVYTLDQAIARRQQMIEFVKSAIMVDGVDYGAIPGTDKPTLLKPGAEKLASFFGLSLRLEVVETVEDWEGAEHGGEALFYYWYRCQAWRGATVIAEADGSSNSRETKYRWRWVPENELPDHVDRSRLPRRGGSLVEPVFAIDRAETTGRYGKPAEYWENFRRAVETGTARRVRKSKRGGGEMDAWEIKSWLYRIPNEDVASQINTIQKMAQKRAIVAATLLAVNASEFFTQDVEDLADQAPSTNRVPEAPAVPESRAELAEAIKNVLMGANEAHKQRIEAVRDAIFGARRRDANSWSIEEMRALRDSAVEIARQDYEPTSPPQPEEPPIRERKTRRNPVLEAVAAPQDTNDTVAERTVEDPLGDRKSLFQAGAGDLAKAA